MKLRKGKDAIKTHRVRNVKGASTNERGKGKIKSKLAITKTFGGVDCRIC